MLKRLSDILIGGTALTLLAPAILLIAAVIRLTMGSPVLFYQDRPGKDGRIFRMVKFRTMRQSVGDDGEPLPDADRLTPLGTFLRRTSLDELPELWNVVRGDMSLVGPRPLLPEYLPLYSDWQARRHEVRPGITGWAQVNGRNSLTWDDRFRMDVWYVDNRNFLLDVKILLLTLKTVFAREGISHEGAATMPVFEGRPGGEQSCR